MHRGKAYKGQNSNHARLCRRVGKADATLLSTILPSAEIPRPLHQLLVLMLLHLQLPLSLHGDQKHLASPRTWSLSDHGLNVCDSLDLLLVSQLESPLSLKHTFLERVPCVALLRRLLNGSALLLRILDADDGRRGRSVGPFPARIGVFGQDDPHLVTLLLSLGGFALACTSFPFLLRKRLWWRRRFERPKLGDLFVQALRSRWPIKMLHGAILIALALLNDLPPYAVILRLVRSTIDVIEEATQGIDNILRSSLGRVAVLPGINLSSALEDVIEGFGRGRWRDSRGQRKWSVEGEERGDGEVWTRYISFVQVRADKRMTLTRI